MSAGQSNLSQATSPQTQQALLALMQQQQQIELQGRSQNLQLKMQELQLDDQAQGRQHERKMQHEQMKFQNSAMGQQQMAQQQAQERELKAQADNYAKLNASKERMLASEQAAQEKAAKIAYRHELEVKAIAAKVAAAEGKDREKALGELKAAQAKALAYAQTKSQADLRHAHKIAGAEAGFSNYINQGVEATSKMADHLQEASKASAPKLAELFANLLSVRGEGDVLNAEPSSYLQNFQGTVRGVDTGYLKDHPGHPVQGSPQSQLLHNGNIGILGLSKAAGYIPETLTTALNMVLPESWEVDKQQAAASPMDPQQLMQSLTGPLAEALAPAYGLEKETVREGLSAMFNAAMTAGSGHPKSGDEVTTLLQNYMKNWGEPGKMSPSILNSIANQLGQISEAQLSKVVTEMQGAEAQANEADIKDLGSDLTNRRYQQLKALKGVLTTLSNAPHALTLGGMRMDAEEHRDMMKKMAAAINSADSPEDKARKASEFRSLLKDVPGGNFADVERFFNETADLEKYQAGDEQQIRALNYEMNLQKMNLENVERYGTPGSAALEYDLLQKMADRG